MCGGIVSATNANDRSSRLVSSIDSICIWGCVLASCESTDPKFSAVCHLHVSVRVASIWPHLEHYIARSRFLDVSHLVTCSVVDAINDAVQIPYHRAVWRSGPGRCGIAIVCRCKLSRSQRTLNAKAQPFVCKAPTNGVEIAPCLKPLLQTNGARGVSHSRCKAPVRTLVSSPRSKGVPPIVYKRGADTWQCMVLLLLVH